MKFYGLPTFVHFLYLNIGELGTNKNRIPNPTQPQLLATTCINLMMRYTIEKFCFLHASSAKALAKILIGPLNSTYNNIIPIIVHNNCRSVSQNIVYVYIIFTRHPPH